MTAELMQLKILTPVTELLHQEVARLRVPTLDGFVGLLPRHIDYATALAPGILVFENAEGRTGYVGVDEGILVKHGRTVALSTSGAITGYDLGEVREGFERKRQAQQEQERRARSALGRLEATFVRQFVRLEDLGDAGDE